MNDNELVKHKSDLREDPLWKDFFRLSKSFSLQSDLTPPEIFHVLRQMVRKSQSPRPTESKRYEVDINTEMRPYQFTLTVMNRTSHLDGSSSGMVFYIDARIYSDPNLTTTRITGKVYASGADMFMLVLGVPVYILAFALMSLTFQGWNQLCGTLIFVIVAAVIWGMFVSDRNTALKALRKALIAQRTNLVRN
jgi:hypothetical protein